MMHDAEMDTMLSKMGKMAPRGMPRKMKKDMGDKKPMKKAKSGFEMLRPR